MPFRRAYFAVLALLLVTILAFWRGYISKLPDHGLAHHLHGVTATAWMLLLIAQSALVDRRHFRLHRRLGRSMLAIVPLFTAAGCMMLTTMTAAETEFSDALGDRLAFVDAVATFAFAGFCMAALVHRRTPALHGGYLLVTPGLLVMAVITRLPILYAADGPLAGWAWQAQFSFGFDLAAVLVLAGAIVMGLRHRRTSQPFIALAAVTVIQWIGFHTLDGNAAWKSVADGIASTPLPIMGSLGMLVGLLAVWIGWRRGGRSARSRAALA